MSVRLTGKVFLHGDVMEIRGFNYGGYAGAGVILVR